MILVSFVVEIGQRIRRLRSGSSCDSPTRDQVEEDHDDGNDQEDMNEPAQGGAGHQTKEPQNQEYYRNCP
jgi:hypothetical protein